MPKVVQIKPSEVPGSPSGDGQADIIGCGVAGPFVAKAKDWFFV